MKNKERVIFRRERDPYTKKWNYIACFPDDPAYVYWSFIGGIPFYLKDENDPTSWVREPYASMAYGYYIKTKIIHKNDPIIPVLVAALESMELQDDPDCNYCGYQVVEKNR